MDKPSVYGENCLKSAIIALYHITNTLVYNQDFEKKDIQKTTSRSIGILASPTKFRNFEDQLVQASNLYKTFFSEENVAALFKLVTTQFLAKKDWSQWEDDPESFIENGIVFQINLIEDETLFATEFDIEADS